VTGEPFTYKNWGPLEPFNNGNRIGMFGYHRLMGSYWNDAPDYYKPYGYIVESETVPEPATVFMLGLGSLSLLRKRRNRK